MSDKLVFDLSQEVEGTPNVFVRKDWVNILDNQNQNYNNNQSIIDTSQLSNSNKYMSYREAYLSVPLLLTFGQTAVPTVTTLTTGSAIDASIIRCGTTGTPNDTNTSLDHSIGLKNWFGQIIHSFTLEYNGTTICQQTPFINMWNSFKLMTSLSLNDVSTQGSTIGFFPDDPTSWGFMYPTANVAVGAAVVLSDTFSGQGVVNNTNFAQISTGTLSQNNSYNSMLGNDGFLRRQRLINYDADAFAGAGIVTASRTANVGCSPTAYSALLTADNTKNLWKSYLSSKRADSIAVSAAGVPSVTTYGYIQYSIIGSVYLKHIHSFFNMCPLLKGVFMKLTLNLNNTSSTIKCAQVSSAIGNALVPAGIQCTAVSNAIGGVNPIMLASGCTNNGLAGLLVSPSATVSTAAGQVTYTLTANLSVGANCLDQSLSTVISGASGQLSKSIYLYVPAMTFNPTFEQAYLSNSVKQIKYTDVYQYQILNVASNGLMNNLVTNGISNIKSVLILPFFSSTAADSGTVYTNRFGTSISTNTGFLKGIPVFQSPFDPAGTGPTSPLSHLTQFNVQISGQNAIYNTQRYIWEEFNHQLYGQNAVNGGLTDGITSGLIDRQAFDLEYCYYYVNVERMLPVEMSVPKSVQILGTNTSSKAMDYFVFVEYGVEIQIDALTGARV
jgi:hypothetical protein